MKLLGAHSTFTRPVGYHLAQEMLLQLKVTSRNFPGRLFRCILQAHARACLPTLTVREGLGLVQRVMIIQRQKVNWNNNYFWLWYDVNICTGKIKLRTGLFNLLKLKKLMRSFKCDMPWTDILNIVVLKHDIFIDVSFCQVHLTARLLKPWTRSDLIFLVASAAIGKEAVISSIYFKMLANAGCFILIVFSLDRS